MFRLRTLFVFVALLVCIVPAKGATYVVPPDEWLIDDAAAIVSGRIVDAHSRYNARQEIETVFRMVVDEALKGTPGDSVEIVQWGGRIGDRWMAVSGGPRYELGKRYVAFLVRDRDGRWTTQDLALGRFEYAMTADGEVLVRAIDDIHGWDIHGNEAKDFARRAPEFVSFIRDRVKGIESKPAYAVRATMKPAPERRNVRADDFPGYDFADAANVGVARWNDHADSNVNFSISGSAATGNTKNVGDGEDRIIEEDPNGDIAGSFGGSGTVAVAFMAGSGTHNFEEKTYITITQADIVTQDGFKNNGSSQSVFRTAMVHEVGHTLGFRHSNQSPDSQSTCSAPLPCVSGSSNAVMNSSVGALNGSLQPWDRDAAAAAYGDGGDASDYTSKFCANPSCTTFTAETGRRNSLSPSASFRLAQQACSGPSITTHPQSKTISLGATTSLSVSAGGSTPLSYQWYIGASNTDESNPIGGANSATLSNLSPEETTKYWVKVTNACGTALSNVATITVQACTPPAISVQPQPKTVSLGDTVRVSVGATGSTPLSYQWYVGNSGDTSNPIPGATTSSPTLTLTQTSSIWVRVTGQCAPAADSNAVTITVTECPAVVVGTPTATGAASNWTLSVNATSLASGTLQYEWFRGSNPGSNVAPKVGDGQTLAVTVDAVTAFWAKVTNSCGAVGFSELVVVAPCQLPVITEQPADRTISKGSTTQLTVGISGENVTVQWYQGTAPDKTIAIGTGASIATAALQETTSFWASLTNTCGEISTRTVTVQVVEGCEPPVITTHPASQQVSKGQSVTLGVAATGSPLLKYEWFEGAVGDTSKPVGTDFPIFTTPAIEKTTRYWVRISNDCGSANSTAAELRVPKSRRRATRS